jgi:uncharacterized SAM-binding protein YcdF (DUF218 family)
VAAIVAAIGWRRPIGRRFAGVTVALVLVLGLLPTGWLLLRPLETRFPIPSGITDVDGIVVLAGSEQVELSELYSQPQLGSAGDRLTTFLMLAAAHPSARLVHSGFREEPAARELILGAGVAPSRIVFDDRARNTCGSATEVRALVGPQHGDRWLLVTSASHMPRAVACFRAVGWDIVPYPADFGTDPSPWSSDLVGNLDALDTAAHEWVGLLYYRLLGRTDDLYPAPSGL